MKLKALVLTLAALLLSSCSSNQLTEQTPEEKKAEVYYGQGTSDLVNENYSQALINLTKAKELSPKDSKIRNNLGMAYYFRNQPALAEAELKESIKLDKKNTDARLNLGSLYMSKNRFKDAREQFDLVAADLTFANHFRNYYNLAVLSLKEGDRKSAFEFLEKSVAEREDYCAAHFMLGELHSEEYRYKQALTAFRNSSKGTCVSEPAPHYQQAITLLNLNRSSEAKAKFLEVQEKFSSTKFATLAGIQIKKLNNTNDQPTTRSTQTERIFDSESVETPNF